MFPLTFRIDGNRIEAVGAALAPIYDEDAVSVTIESARADIGGHLCARCGEPIESTNSAPYWRHTDPEHEHAPAYCARALDNLTCGTCGEDIEPAGDNSGAAYFVHIDDTPEGGHLARAEDDDLSERDTATPSPLDWLNSARMTIDPDEDAAHMAISTGDPRGAHVFTVRRVQPDGEPPALILHTPHPGDAGPHTGLEPLHAGTYREAPYPAGADLRPVWLTDDERDTITRALSHAGPPADTIAAKIRRA